MEEKTKTVCIPCDGGGDFIGDKGGDGLSVGEWASHFFFIFFVSRKSEKKFDRSYRERFFFWGMELLLQRRNEEDDGGGVRAPLGLRMLNEDMRQQAAIFIDKMRRVIVWIIKEKIKIKSSKCVCVCVCWGLDCSLVRVNLILLHYYVISSCGHWHLVKSFIYCNYYLI